MHWQTESLVNYNKCAMHWSNIYIHSEATLFVFMVCHSGVTSKAVHSQSQCHGNELWSFHLHTMTCLHVCAFVTASEFTTLWQDRNTLLLLIIQCFDAVGWVAEWHPACKKNEWWGTGVVIYLERGANWFAYGPADATATHHLLLQ